MIYKKETALEASANWAVGMPRLCEHKITAQCTVICDVAECEVKIVIQFLHTPKGYNCALYDE
jgi:hypothetical protein